MKFRTGFFSTIIASAAAIAAFSANAIELERVQKKLDQFAEHNSCTEETRSSQFASVFLHFNASSEDVSRIGRAVLKTDFEEFEIGFDHEKGEYHYSDIFGKEKHFEQLHTECESGSCDFNMVMYPKLAFPDGFDNTDVRMTFYDQDNKRITDFKRNIGAFDAYAFEADLIPFEAFMEDKTIVVRKLPSEHEYEHYVVGLHIGIDGKKHEIDVVVNKDQASEGVLLGYPGYSNITYLGVYFEPSHYEDGLDVSRVENKVELYDSEKDFFKSCKP